MPGSILIVHYETTTGKYLVQKAGSAQISDGAITSAQIASGIIGTVHLRDLNVTSAKLAAAIIGLLGTVVDEAITSAKIASGAVGTVHMYPGAVTSSILASGQVGIPHIYPGAVVSAKIGALAVATPHLAALAVEEAKIGWGAVTSGKIGANAIATPHIKNQGILSASFGANILATPHIKNQGILSASIGAGEIGDTLLTDFGLISGKYASGSITEQALVSGISIDIAEVCQEPSYRAGELVSAYQGIQFSTSGYFGLAKVDDIDTMPAVGVTIANVASGAIGTFQYQGRITNAAWDFSGYVGNLLFLGSGQNVSEVTRIAPSTSGECVQRVGKVVGPTIVFLRPELHYVQIAE